MAQEIEFYEQYDLTKMGWTPSVVNMLGGQSIIDSYTPLSTARYTLAQMGQYLQRQMRAAPGVQDLIDYLYQVADRFGIPRNLAYRQIERESNFDPDVIYGRKVSSKGAVGIAQFMPATAADYGLTDRTDPYASLDAWGEYMSDLLNMFDDDYERALAGYNWGQGRVIGAVKRWGASWLRRAPRETREYVAYILGGLRDVVEGSAQDDEWFDPTTGMSVPPGTPGAMRRPPSGYGSKAGAGGCAWYDLGCHLDSFLSGETAKDMGKRIGLVLLAVVLLAVAVISLR